MGEAKVAAAEQAKMQQATETIVIAMQGLGLRSALTILCNLTGQLIAAQAGGQPSKVQAMSNTVAENIKRGAIAKLLHDDQQRRNKDAAPALDS